MSFSNQSNLGDTYINNVWPGLPQPLDQSGQVENSALPESPENFSPEPNQTLNEQAKASEKLLEDAQGTSSASGPKDALEALAQSFIYSGIEAPINGVTELINQAIGDDVIGELHLVGQPVQAPAGSLEGSAQLLGSVLGSTIPFIVASKVVGKVGRFANVAPLYENAIARNTISGAIMGGVMRPVGREHENDWLSQRLKNAAVDGGTFGALSAFSQGIGSLSRRYLPNAGASVDSFLAARVSSPEVLSLRKPMTEIGLSIGAAMPAGAAGAQLDSILNQGRPATLEEMKNSAVEFGALSATLGGLHMVNPKIFNATPGKSSARPPIEKAQVKTPTSSAKKTENATPEPSGKIYARVLEAQTPPKAAAAKEAKPSNESSRQAEAKNSAEGKPEKPTAASGPVSVSETSLRIEGRQVFPQGAILEDGKLANGFVHSIEDSKFGRTYKRTDGVGIFGEGTANEIKIDYGSLRTDRFSKPTIVENQQVGHLTVTEIQYDGRITAYQNSLGVRGKGSATEVRVYNDGGAVYEFFKAPIRVNLGPAGEGFATEIVHTPYKVEFLNRDGIKGSGSPVSIEISKVSPSELMERAEIVLDKGAIKAAIKKSSMFDPYRIEGMRFNYEGGGSPWDPAPGLTVDVRLKDAHRNSFSKQLSEKDIVQIFKDDINADGVAREFYGSFRYDPGMIYNPGPGYTGTITYFHTSPSGDMQVPFLRGTGESSTGILIRGTQES